MGMLLKRRPKVNLTTSAALEGVAEETPVVDTPVETPVETKTEMSKKSKKKGE